LQPGFLFSGAAFSAPQEASSDPGAMRDKKDNATQDLVGFDGNLAPAAPQPAEPPARRASRSRIVGIRQHQLSLLEETDTSGLPVWRQEEGFDQSGLPVWAAA
jgi:hypothetical protein